MFEDHDLRNYITHTFTNQHTTYSQRTDEAIQFLIFFYAPITPRNESNMPKPLEVNARTNERNI